MNQTSKLKQAVAAALMLGCTAGAQATDRSGLESVSFEIRLPDFDRGFIFRPGTGDRTASRAINGVPKFDPALGTLVDVAISFDYPFELDVEIEADDILNFGAPHSASFSAGEISFGVSFLNTVQNPPMTNLVGTTINDFTVECEGNSAPPCTNTIEQTLSGSAPETSVANAIPLNDFIGSGNYDGFSFQFEVLQPSIERNNVAEAAGYVDGSVSTELTSFTITYFYGSDASDTDGDGVADFADNCLNAPNPDQVDADADNIGNACDADTNNDCIVNFSDLADLSAGFFGSDPVLDLDGDGSVNFSDLAIMKEAFFAVPGPSGLTNACAPGSTSSSTPVAFQEAE